MKIDIHVHASERSGCSVSSEHDLIRSAMDYGLDALVFTDHSRLMSAEHGDELNRQYAPFRIFSGVEITTNESEDILVFGIRDQRLEDPSWGYADLHRFVRTHGGFMVLAHPFRYRDFVHASIYELPPDAVELHSCNIQPETSPRIQDLAHDLSLPLTCASDAHEADNVGKYFIRLGEVPDNDRMLIDLLQARNYRCGMR